MAPIGASVTRCRPWATAHFGSTRPTLDRSLAAMNPVSSVSAPLSAQYSISVASKSLDSTKQQGQAAVSLIQSSAPANTPTSVGRALNVVA
jgi:hypothetical protein